MESLSEAALSERASHVIVRATPQQRRLAHGGIGISEGEGPYWTVLADWTGRRVSQDS